MSCDAGHFENPGALARLKNSGASGNGDDWHRGARGRTGDAWPSPSQVGEDEVARDEVMRGSAVEAWRSRGLGRNRSSRWMRRGSGALRRCARGVPSGRRRGMCDEHLYGSAANRGRQWRAQRSCASPLHAGLDGRVDTAMAPECGRHLGDATRALVVFAGTGGDGGAPRR
jgi:hypothetical protein